MYDPNNGVERNKLYKCDATGAGCLMIKYSALQKVAHPFFHQQPPFADSSEEMALFKQFKEKEIPVHVDTTVNCGHAFTSFPDFETFDLLRSTKDKELAIVGEKEKEPENGKPKLEVVRR
jgi:hypothetical protein